MTRRTKLALGSVAAAVVVVGAGVWLGAGVPKRDAGAPTSRSSASRSAQAVGGSLSDLMMDLELVPMDGQTPKPFTLESLDGKRVALADLAGRPALLYFWATW
jgi:cytochrome oxidase Cu insertion factor (SCO1/SenC/PrrC family)